MSVYIRPISGDAQSISRNDAYSIVSTSDDAGEQSWAIIPDADLQQKDKMEIVRIFARAANSNGASEEIVEQTAEAAKAFADDYLANTPSGNGNTGDDDYASYNAAPDAPTPSI